MALTNEDLLAISELVRVQLKSGLEPMKSDIAELKGDMAGMKGDIAELRSDMEEGFSRIHLILENEIRPQIKMLAENYMPAAKRYEQSSNQIEMIQADVGTIKKVIQEHSKILQRIS